ncbi:nucleotidyltransferase family protein [Phaeobacter marinintestinus]|uniref:nucleotidyltransferase family protein n=1 Tax=Falsiphaeobacter marinintestinus TaxID=1492905 RepID=UPI0011B48322|nr:nucleotidyltransferase family protein [Phaeobacter marinintestinus]
MITEIPILILAAGQSNRMRGADKLMQPIDGEPLLRRSTGIALQSGIGPVILALPTLPHPRYGAVEGMDVTTVPVPDAFEGMNASLRRGIAALPENSAAVMILLADLPDLTAHDLKLVSEAVDLEPEFSIWRGATETGEPGHPVIFSADLFADLAKLTGDAGAQSVVQRHKTKTQLVPLPGNRARTDLDTPEAWADWAANRT